MVVEIDTPAHVHSWGRNDKYKDIVLSCNKMYAGQLDPTMDLTYQTVNELMKFVDKTFEDPFVHFGAD